MPLGTDVNFGVITRQLTAGLQRSPNFSLHLNHEVTALRQNADKSWNVTVKDLKAGTETTTHARFRFIGAGGAALCCCRCPAFRNRRTMPASRSVASSSPSRAVT